MAVKLIALDLDGTLFTDQKTVSDGNRKALAQARARGAELVVASGRPLHNVSVDLFRELGMQYMIASNGAAVYRLDSGTAIYEDPMEPEAVQELIALCMRYPVMLCIFTDSVTLIPEKVLPALEQPGTPGIFRNFFRSGCQAVEDPGAYVREQGLPVYKLAVYFDFFSDNPDYYYDLIRNAVDADPRFVQVDGGGHGVEITMAGVSKGKALAWLAGELGIGIADTMACGDTENDIEILKTAGIGVAMGNAMEHVKAAADFVTKTNQEDGVAFAIQHFMGKSV